MGYIRQLKDKDLVGGTTLENIYPITATSAVYGEDGRSLDLILSTISSGQGGNGSSTFPSRLENYENIIIFGAGREAMTDASIKAIRSTRGIPVGWSQTSNIPLNKNLYVYMATGKKINGSFVPIDGNYYWSYPLRISGAPGDSSTSNTGADGANINFVYYRTNTFIEDTTTILPLFDPSTIESITNKNHGVDRNGTLVNSNTAPAWRDHPLGISKDYNYEYISVNYSKANSAGQLEWQGYSLPSLWSNWGLNGIDGDGVEYIFCLWPYLIQDQGTHNIIDVNTAQEGSPGKTKLDDDFIPNNPLATGQLSEFLWTDDPLDVREDAPYLYVSIRKRTWNEQDLASEWGDFSRPTLWSRFGKDGIATEYTLQSDNDNQVIDDDCHGNVAQGLNATFTLSKNGEVQSSNVYFEVNEDSTTIPVSDGSNVWEVPIINSTTGELTYTLDTSIKKIPEGTYKTSVDAYILDDQGEKNIAGERYRKVASRVLVILVRDFSAGESYKLIVEPQSIKVDLDNKVLENIDFRVTALKVSSSGTEDITLIKSEDKYVNNENNLSTVIKKANGYTALVSKGTTIDGNYLIFNLLLTKEGKPFRVDSETINIYKDGKDGEGIYDVALSNSTIILDDAMPNGIYASDYNLNILSKASAITYTLYNGGKEVQESDYIVTSGEGTSLPNGFNSDINKKSASLLYSGTSTSFATGTYKLLLLFTSTDGNTTYATKDVNIYITDITPDGSVYKLNVTNNYRVFESNLINDGSDLNSIITVTKLTNGQPQTVPFKTSSLLPSNNKGLLVKYSLASTLVSGLSDFAIIDSILITYRLEGYSIELYYDTTLVDSENIVCIKNGADGDGTSTPGEQGPPGESNDLVVSAQSIFYMPSTNTFVPNTITASYMNTKYEEDKFVTSCDTTKTVEYIISNITSFDSILNKGTGISGTPYTLPKGGNLSRGNNYILTCKCDNFTKTVPIIIEPALGIEGCVVRYTKWEVGKTYRNDRNDPLSAGDVKYIDVAYRDGNSTDFYMCTHTHLSSNDILLGNEDYWQLMLALDPSFTPLLVTDNLVFKEGQGNNLYLMSSDGKVLGGMMSGVSNRKNVRIFAGTNISLENSNPTLDDISNAPFRVYDDGMLVANNAVITGTGQFTGDVIANSFLATAGNNMSVKVTENQFQFIGIDSVGTTRPLAYFKYGIDADAGATTPTVLLYIWTTINGISEYRAIDLNKMISPSSDVITTIDHIFTNDRAKDIYRGLVTYSNVICKNGKYYQNDILLNSTLIVYASKWKLAVVKIPSNSENTFFYLLVLEVCSITYTLSTKTINGYVYIAPKATLNDNYIDEDSSTLMLYKGETTSGQTGTIHMDKGNAVYTINSSARCLGVSTAPLAVNDASTTLDVSLFANTSEYNLLGLPYA